MENDRIEEQNVKR